MTKCQLSIILFPFAGFSFYEVKFYAVLHFQPEIMSSSRSAESVDSSAYDSYTENLHIKKFPKVTSQQFVTNSEDKIVGKSDKVVVWPSNENFNVAAGFTKIEELIDTWERKDYWKHCINYISQMKAISSDYYFYEVSIH